MKSLIKKTIFGGVLTAMLALTSCHAPKNVTYLKEAERLPAEVLRTAPAPAEPILRPGDLLNINVYASNMASVAKFNKGLTVTPEGTVQNINVQSTNSLGNGNYNASTDFYLVDTHGDIEFPVLGTIHVAGMNKEQLAQEIRSGIYPKYVTAPPTVDVRLMNFKVTILGAVKTPGVVESSNERLNLLEALAMAGDLDIKGERENLLLYRTNADGTHQVERLNLNDKGLLVSPYFNLQQNDIIYVEPNRSAKQNAWQMHQGWNVAISVVGGISSVAALVIGIVNLSK